MTHQQFVSILFEIEATAHKKHLQSLSYAEHMALGPLYEDIVGLRDRYVESYQGKYGLLKGYQINNKQEDLDIISYLKSQVVLIESFRKDLIDGYLQQICDDILELIYSTIYKLTFLK